MTSTTQEIQELTVKDSMVQYRVRNEVIEKNPGTGRELKSGRAKNLLNVQKTAEARRY